ncbi:MAG: glucose-6-phosphate isomerase [Gammaproteobacteria bacterium]|nr:glucose-6-phosphate isomerase [Gammaproteobacteria bacterium]
MNQHWPESLIKEAEKLKGVRISDLFSQEADRLSYLSANACGIYIDASKNLINHVAFEELVSFAQKKRVTDAIKSMFQGNKINYTENRAVLHTLLRSSQSNVAEYEAVKSERHNVSEFAEQIRSGKTLGATGKPIKFIVNIGIGGSDLGPQLLVDAFRSSIPTTLDYEFLSDVDDEQLDYIWKRVDPEATLFILCSKSFTTWETQTNAKRVIERLKEAVGDNWNKHFAGVAVDVDAMSRFGILPQRQFKIWDFVGGRYSVWSSVNLIARILLGNKLVDEFLFGAEDMDKHFQDAPLDSNLPVLLALIQTWNIQFLNHSVFITLPYSHGLRLFPDYQQQLEMESNGKRVDRQGQPINWPTCPYIFGQLGLNAQHAFMQLVHQSDRQTYVEFIAVPSKTRNFEDDVAFRSCLAQSQALMEGTLDESVEEKRCPGNRPSTTLVLDKLTPKTLGSLVALYEHKVFVQSVLWDINAFDQFGVELGKKIATQLTSKSVEDNNVDDSTRSLIRFHSAS